MEKKRFNYLGFAGTICAFLLLQSLIENKPVFFSPQQQAERIQHARAKQLIDLGCSYAPDVCRLVDRILR